MMPPLPRGTPAARRLGGAASFAASPQQRVAPRAAGDGRQGRDQGKGSLPNLEQWQVEELEQAYMKGRRKAKLNDLAKKVQLDRKDVLQWMKDFSQKPERIQQSVLEARTAAMSAAKERREFINAKQKRKEVEEDITDQWRAANMSARERVQILVNKPLGRQEIDTLERVYQQTKYPSEDVLKSLFDLHRIPRVRAVQWFKDKRAGKDASGRQEQKADGADEWHGGTDKGRPQDV